MSAFSFFFAPKPYLHLKERKAADKPRKRSAKQVVKNSPPQNGQSMSELSNLPVFVSSASPALSLTSGSPDHNYADSPLGKTTKKLNLAGAPMVGPIGPVGVGGVVASAGAIKRPKVLSNRRQMFICEFPGCNYQSDRNFNFLRHKRTHGRIKGDSRKTQIHAQRFIMEGDALRRVSAVEPAKVSTIVKQSPSEQTIIANPSTITLNERLHIEENDQSMTYESDHDAFIERSDLIMRDLNLNHLNVLTDNNHNKHNFAHIAIQQPFIS